jgi:hypothetical protein
MSEDESMAEMMADGKKVGSNKSVKNNLCTCATNYWNNRRSYTLFICMTPFRCLSVLILCFLTACATTDQSKGSRSLFNGKNLDGWVPLHGGEWTVENGELIGRKGVAWTTNSEKSGSWLRTEKEYTDFIFELEYSVNEKGNSGVFIRSAIEKNPAFTGHEIQILDDHGREPKKFTTGSLYDVVAPTKNMSKPANEWNTLKIEARGPRV